MGLYRQQVNNENTQQNLKTFMYTTPHRRAGQAVIVSTTCRRSGYQQIKVNDVNKSSMLPKTFYRQHSTQAMSRLDAEKQHHGGQDVPPQCTGGKTPRSPKLKSTNRRCRRRQSHPVCSIIHLLLLTNKDAGAGKAIPSAPHTYNG